MVLHNANEVGPGVPGCLSDEELVELADGRLPTEALARAHLHAPECGTCRGLLARFHRQLPGRGRAAAAACRRFVRAELNGVGTRRGFRRRVGEESYGVFTGRTSEAIADPLGQRATVFPSHHGGFLGPESGYPGRPEAFARKLRDVLDDDN